MSVSTGGGDIDLNAILAGGDAFTTRLQQLKDAKEAVDASFANLREAQAAVEKGVANARAEAERIIAEARSKAKEIARMADERTARAEAARDLALGAIAKLEAL